MIESLALIVDLLVLREIANQLLAFVLISVVQSANEAIVLILRPLVDTPAGEGSLIVIASSQKESLFILSEGDIFPLCNIKNVLLLEICLELIYVGLHSHVSVEPTADFAQLMSFFMAFFNLSFNDREILKRNIAGG